MGSPQNGEVWRLTGSGVHDASLLAHCWRFLLLYALAIFSTLWSPNRWRRCAAKGNDVEFSIHCEQLWNWTPSTRWKCSSQRIKKICVYVKIVGAQHLRLKRRDKRRNSSPFYNASTWTGVSATNRSLVYREESDYYIVTSYRGCIQKSPLTHSNLLNRRKIELVSWEFNYESGSCVLEITSIEKA